jgi:hypothetical protein
MKKLNLIFIQILSIFILFSSPVTYAEPMDIPQAKEDKGLVVFYRESSIKGGAIRFNLNLGQDPIGALPSGSVLHRYVEPGQQTFWSQVISKDSISIDVVAGETYYIKGTVKMGLVAGRPTLTVVSEDEA